MQFAPNLPTLGWVSSPPSGLQGGEESHAHQEGSLSIKTSSVMSKAEGRNLVHFIIEVIQLFNEGTLGLVASQIRSVDRVRRWVTLFRL